MTAKRAEYLCVNGYGHPAIPIEVASEVIKKWCEENPQMKPQQREGIWGWQGASEAKPYTVLAELSGVHVRRMYSLFNGFPTVSHTHDRPNPCITATVSLPMMDKVVTVGMDQPELWYAPPLDLYYLPMDEWTDEMKERHGQA